MRDMRSTKFCEVDQENMWHQFLNRVDLIDSVDQTPIEDKDGKQSNIVSVKTPALEGLDIRWFTDVTSETGEVKEVELEHLRGDKMWLAEAGEDAGNYRVEVRFATDEVRKYSEKFRTSEEFTLS